MHTRTNKILPWFERYSESLYIVQVVFYMLPKKELIIIWKGFVFINHESNVSFLSFVLHIIIITVQNQWITLLYSPMQVQICQRHWMLLLFNLIKKHVLTPNIYSSLPHTKYRYTYHLYLNNSKSLEKLKYIV